MARVPPPSTDWREKIAPDEEARYAGYARQFTQMQARKTARLGDGRALHRKQLVAVHGSLEVLDGLPAFARQGLFATPRDYEVLVRLSSGGPDRSPDYRPDVRGFALRVLGIEGPSALGNGPAKSQDFTLINHEAFAFPDSDGFVGFVIAASSGPVALLSYAVRRYGVLGGPKQLARLLRMVKKPFSGFASEPFFSAVPMANGEYAVRVRLMPASSNGEAATDACYNWAADFGERLKLTPLHWDLQLQFFTSERLTPIEDASVVWSTPYTTVARLMLPQQDAASPEGQELAEQVEDAVFDPWQALADHRPLGDVQRARKAVYFASQKARRAG